MIQTYNFFVSEFFRYGLRFGQFVWWVASCLAERGAMSRHGRQNLRRGHLFRKVRKQGIRRQTSSCHGSPPSLFVVNACLIGNSVVAWWTTVAVAAAILLEFLLAKIHACARPRRCTPPRATTGAVTAQWPALPYRKSRHKKICIVIIST